MIGFQLNDEMTFLLSQIRRLATTASSLTTLQMGVAEAISEGLTYYSWTGFYMLDPTDSSMLILGPFVGDPTPSYAKLFVFTPTTLMPCVESLVASKASCLNSIILTI